MPLVNIDDVDDNGSGTEPSSDSEDSLVIDSTSVSDVSSEYSSEPLSKWPTATDDDVSDVNDAASDKPSDPFLAVQGVHGVNRRWKSPPKPVAAELMTFSEAEHKAAARTGKHNYTDINEFADRSIQHEINVDTAIYPSVDPTLQAAIVQRYRDLHQKVQDMGYYDCPYLEYGKEAARYTTLFVAFLGLLHMGWYIPSAICLGLFWHQIMFTAHDAGHRAITHNFVADSIIGMFVADFCCGLSIGWWKSSHNVHHLVTNHPEHDPDIQNVPIFATSPAFFKSINSSYYNGFVFLWDAAADFMVPYQKYTYYPIMGVARFNLYLLSWLHVVSPKAFALGKSTAWWIQPAEIFCMACYWFLFGYCLVWRSIPTWTDRIVFVLVAHIITMPLHVQITLSHWGMSHSDLGESESFPQRQLRTTMDVDCPAWLDFIHGGLQFQAVHHLFPRVPRHNLRKVQALVREFCDDTNIPYSILNFTDGNAKVLGRLQEIGEQVNIMVKCQKYMAETGESGLA